MKKAEIGDYLKWKGELAKIIASADRRTVVIELLEDRLCPHCCKSLGKKQFSVIPTSPLFQENAEPLQTLES